MLHELMGTQHVEANRRTIYSADSRQGKDRRVRQNRVAKQERHRHKHRDRDRTRDG